MIEKLKQMLSGVLVNDADLFLADSESSKWLAAVALMVEIIAVDDVQHEAEKHMLREILSRQFEVDDGEIDGLISEAEHAHQQATDYYRFTSEINQQFSAEEKIDLIELLWKLAWADEEIHELEQHVIRRLSNLLHISHKDFIAAKLRVVGG